MPAQKYYEYKQINNNIHKYRSKVKVTVEDVADFCGTSTAIISNLANGKRSPVDKNGLIRKEIPLLCKILVANRKSLFPALDRKTEKLKSNRKMVRNIRITNMILNGTTLEKISKKFKISRARARQVFRKILFLSLRHSKQMPLSSEDRSFAKIRVARQSKLYCHTIVMEFTKYLLLENNIPKKKGIKS